LSPRRCLPLWRWCSRDPPGLLRIRGPGRQRRALLLRIVEQRDAGSFSLLAARRTGLGPPNEEAREQTAWKPVRKVRKGARAAEAQSGYRWIAGADRTRPQVGAGAVCGRGAWWVQLQSRASQRSANPRLLACGVPAAKGGGFHARNGRIQSPGRASVQAVRLAGPQNRWALPRLHPSRLGHRLINAEFCSQWAGRLLRQGHSKFGRSVHACNLRPRCSAQGRYKHAAHVPRAHVGIRGRLPPLRRANLQIE
jgi:hypothetical protein